VFQQIFGERVALFLSAYRSGWFVFSSPTDRSYHGQNTEQAKQEQCSSQETHRLCSGLYYPPYEHPKGYDEPYA
jgi:hypothetical protein